MKKMFIILLATTMMYLSLGCTKKVPSHTAATLPHKENTSFESQTPNKPRQNIDITIDSDSSVTNSPNLERFFFVPFETGSIQTSTSNFGYFEDYEVFIGIFATATTPEFSGIQNLCRELSEADTSFAGELTHFALWSNSQVIEDIKSPNSEIGSAFKKLDQKDHQKFLNLQISIMEKRYKDIIVEQNIEWLLDGSHSSALIGSYYSLLCWMPYAGWEHSISSEKSDKENLISLYYKIFEKCTDNSNIEKRFEKQMILALDMMYGEKTKQEITNWMINPEW